ncbi:hypothetical protein LMG26696_02556 [Achromobacter pulmonis]|uniref:DUF1120 domain-containing protein n=1 Tax=Achromobacter pulmonis TaxID=1389932 RepID=UPI00146953AB|nr:DUF1120 domain-containing protein [Achromobacter pulmonis]CAB3646927.1 hypothetical protein LMG26696_02556 [Achromobacter pulmonis]
MKLRTLFCWTVAAMPLASQAQDVPLNIAVQGQIKPAACALQIAEQGTFNYGRIQPKALKRDSFTLLPTLDRELRISCEAKSQVALTISDSNAGKVAFSQDIVFFGGSGKSWSPSRQYGLRDDTGRSMGAWALQLVPGFKVDQQPTDSIYSSDRGVTWQPSVGNFFHDDGSLESWSPSGSKEPVSGSEFVGTMRVQVALDSTARLGLSSETPFIGGAVLTLVYL